MFRTCSSGTTCATGPSWSCSRTRRGLCVLALARRRSPGLGSMARTGPMEGRTRIPWATALTLALPLVGLGLLLARPDLDVEWHHEPSHFWLVLLAAAVNAALAYVTNIAAGRHRDARLVLISLAFLSSAGFLGLHALATPGVLLAASNVGFATATPVGLVIAALFAAASTSPLAGPRAQTVLRLRPLLLGGLIALMVAWAVVSIARLPPLNGPPTAFEGAGPLSVLSFVAVALYA